MSRRAIVAVVILAWLGTASSTVGQTASGAARFHLDFARWAWPTPAAERRERGVLDSVLVQLYRLSRIPPQSAPALRRMLVLADSAAMLVAWHANYWHVRSRRQSLPGARFRVRGCQPAGRRL